MGGVNPFYNPMDPASDALVIRDLLKRIEALERQTSFRQSVAASGLISIAPAAPILVSGDGVVASALFKVDNEVDTFTTSIVQRDIVSGSYSYRVCLDLGLAGINEVHKTATPEIIDDGEHIYVQSLTWSPLGVVTPGNYVRVQVRVVDWSGTGVSELWPPVIQISKTGEGSPVSAPMDTGDEGQGGPPVVLPDTGEWETFIAAYWNGL